MTSVPLSRCWVAYFAKELRRCDFFPLRQMRGSIVILNYSKVEPKISVTPAVLIKDCACSLESGFRVRWKSWIVLSWLPGRFLTLKSFVVRLYAKDLDTIRPVKAAKIV